MEGIKTTVAFVSKDKEAFDLFWQDIRTRYRFCKTGDEIPTQAFAVSVRDMFADQEAIDHLLDSELDAYELKEAIGSIAGCDDLPALFAEYGVEAPEWMSAKAEQREEG